MKSDRINNIIRDFVRRKLSPTLTERRLVSRLYESVCDVLGDACIQIGSFARFTAIRPLHDLDVLHPLGPWDPSAHDPAEALAQLKERLEEEYVNPTNFDVQISSQTHSVTLSFIEGGSEVFSIDIIPAYELAENEFGDPIYMVPEILTSSHSIRRKRYRELAQFGESMNWIPSDPRGYTSVAKIVNDGNPDFRKSAKFAKGWRSKHKEHDDSFPLKAFHLEQILTERFSNDSELEIFDALHGFYSDLPELIERPRIPDRANPQRMIDEYVADLTDQQRRYIAAECARIVRQLEEFSEGDDVATLLQPGDSPGGTPAAPAAAPAVAPVTIRNPSKPWAP